MKEESERESEKVIENERETEKRGVKHRECVCEIDKFPL